MTRPGLLVEWRSLAALPLLATLLLGAGTGCQRQGAEEGAAVDTGEATASEEGPPAWIRASVTQPRGLIHHEPEATPGYVMFTQFTSDSTYLVDLDGQVVHTWVNGKTGLGTYLQDNGDLVRLARMPEPPNFRAGGVAGVVQRLSWDSDVIWEWQHGTEERILHHDIEPLPNGNILAIGWEQISRDEALAAGRRPELIPEQGLWSDFLIEIEPIPPDEARIVWEWRAWDHLVQHVDPELPRYGAPEDHPHRLDINAGADGAVADEEELEQLKALGYVPDDADQDDVQSDFLHMNAVDYHPGLDQIALSLPQLSEIWIIDHSTTTEEARGSTGGRAGRGGDILYRWGNPEAYGQGTEADRRLFYQHEVLWIPQGWGRAGHLTVFNNGGGRPDGDWSSVVEIAPPLDEEGRYVMVSGGAYGPPEPAWSYEAEDRSTFFAPFVSGAHRLENGHTFVCSGPQGRFFELTPDGRIVWEYRNPFRGEVEQWDPPGTENLYYAAFRAAKIAPDHPGLKGRDLRPLDPQPAAYVPPPPEPPAEAPGAEES